MDWDAYVQVIWDLLQTDDQVCWNLMRSSGARVAEVVLVDGATTPSEALAYARTLAELGLVFEAHEVFLAAIRAAFGWVAELAEHVVAFPLAEA
jgi:hypothetical protein